MIAERYVLLIVAFICATAQWSIADETIEGDVQFPEHWTVFVTLNRMDPVLSDDVLKAIPDQITVSGDTFDARTVTPQRNQFDFTDFFGSTNREGKVAYVFVPIESASRQQVTLGMGADWWMHAWLNGERILDTTTSGNGSWPASINDHRVTVTLEKGTNVLAVRFISGSGSSILALAGPDALREGDFRSLLVAERGDGRSMAELYPPAEETLRPTSGWADTFRRDLEPPERDTIPLHPDWADNRIDRRVVTFGVPFPRNVLTDTDHVRVIDGDGNPTPAQIEPTATWDHRDSSIRWALVHAVLEKGQTYALEYGRAVRPAETPGVTIDENDDRITIDTGAMRAEISRTSPAILESVALLTGDADPDDLLITPEMAAASLPEIVDANGNIYTAGGADEGLEVELVERGPMRAAVRRKGWYTGEDGTRFCQFITYTYFHAGQAELRHDHTLVVAFDTQKHQIRDIRLPLPLNLDDSRTAWFAADESPSGALAEHAVNDEPLSLVQAEHDRWMIERAGEQIDEGERAGGWFGLADERWGAFAGIQDFWQQYPAELEIDGNQINLHLWPASESVNVLDFNPSARLGDDYPGDRVFWANWYRDGLDEMTQGFGLGKTHTIQINFFERAQTDAAARQARTINEPVLALADPEWNADSEAFGRVHHHDPERFPRIESLIDTLIHRRQWLRQRLGNYGWFDYGDVNGNLNNPTDPENIRFEHWRRWASMFYGFPNVMPTLYLRSGRRDAWDFHRSNARHITDIDICHLDNDALNKWKGGRYGGNGGIVHFAGNLYNIGCDTHLRFMLFDYYLNGNLRTREVADEYVQAYAARRDLAHNTRYRGRHTGGGLRLFSEAYQATWNPEYLSIMRQFADILYEHAEEESARSIAHDYSDVYVNEGKVLYYQLTGDERMRDQFLSDMRRNARSRDAHVFNDSRATTMQGLTRAYWMTEDRRFLPFAAWQLDVALEKIVTDGQPHENGAIDWTFEHAYTATLGNQLPTIMAMLNESSQRPEPEGPPVAGDGAIYLDEQTDREFHLELQYSLYTDIARPFRNWSEWVGRLPASDQPGVVVLAPDGTEVARESFFDPDSPQKRGITRITVPSDGQRGTYIVQPASRAVPFRMELVGSNLDRAVIHAGDSLVDGASYRFLVPQGTGEFQISIKTTALRGEQMVEILDERGQVVEQTSLPGGANSWMRFELDAESPSVDQAWTIRALPPERLFLRFEGVPSYVASAPSALFIPDRRMDVPAAAQAPEGDELSYLDTDLPWDGDSAVGIPTGRGVRIESADGEPLMSAEQGTVEMWVKSTRDATDWLGRRILLSSGQMSVYRRTGIGTYLTFGSGAHHQTGFVLPRDRWTHLAVTWRQTEAGQTEVALYADGVFVHSSYKRVLDLTDDWPGTELTIPPNSKSGLIVSELRISDHPRYTRNFEPPTEPLRQDEHTILLCPFDEQAEAWIRGQTIEAEPF